VLGVFACAGMILGLQVLIINYYINAITPWERIKFGISALTLIVYFIAETYAFFVVGLGLIIFVSVRQFTTKAQPSKLGLKATDDGM
jgi:hypothetical protein